MTEDVQEYTILQDRGRLRLQQRSTDRRHKGDETLMRFLQKRVNPQWPAPDKLVQFSHDKQLKRTLTNIDEPVLVAQALDLWRRIQKYITSPVHTQVKREREGGGERERWGKEKKRKTKETNKKQQ